jgi:signal recognition particle subunit SRP54
MSDIFSIFRKNFRNFLSKIGITDKDVKEILKELQKTLIASDVDVKLTLELTKRVEQRILNEEKGFTLKEKVVKALYEELTEFFGSSYKVELKKKVIVLIGLYGSGKTTTAAKIGNYFKKKGLSVALISTDTERPAAQEQLKQLAAKINATFYNVTQAQQAVKARKEDVIIIDTAGKNALDKELLDKLRKEYENLKPEEVFLVLPADIGKIAIEQASAFNSVIPINAAIITRFEGSGKAGGAISALARIKIPIAFLGTGEKLEALQEYHVKSLVAKILGMPDFDSLIERIKPIENIEQNEFSLETFYAQLKAFKSNPLSELTSMIGLYDLPKDVLIQGEEKIKKYEAMINSMTKEERKNPEIVKKSQSRIKRIAKGSGLSEQEVISLLNEYFRAEKLVKKLMSDKGMLKKIQKMLPGFKIA